MDALARLIGAVLFFDIIVWATFNMMMGIRRMKFPFVSRLIVRQSCTCLAGFFRWLSTAIRP
jgi:hypothetical protein